MKKLLLTKFATAILFALAAIDANAQQWYQQSFGGQTLYDITFTSPDTGYVVGAAGTIRKTTNAGITWTALPSGTTEYLWSVFFIDADTGYVAGENGTIVKTIDAGATWFPLTSGLITGDHLTSIFFTDAMTGYVAGRFGNIRKTTDAGATWNAQTSGTSNNLEDIFFLDANNGYACGAGGTIRQTSNGGSFWSASTSGTTNALYSVRFANSSVGFAVGLSGTIRKYNATTWFSLTSGTTNSLLDVYLNDVNTAYVSGGSGTILKTTDAGSTWITLTTGTTQDLYTIYFTNANTGYAIGSNGIILKTCNGPVANAGADATICSGASTVIGGSPTATGGTTPYSFAWSPLAGLSDSTLANPVANPTSYTVYSVTVTDNNGCTSSDAMALYVNPVPSLSVTSTTNVTCNGGANGAIDISVSGGGSTYTYIWSNGSTTQDILTISAGTYTVTVTAGNGCTDVKDIFITQPDSLLINFINCTDGWTQKANFGGTARFLPTGFSIGNKGYVAFGYGGSVENDIWEYDVSTDIWTQKANFPSSARYGAAAFSLNGKGYIGTGYDNFSTYFNDFWEYDPIANSWMQKPNFPGAGRYLATAFVIGNKGYISLGGTNSMYLDTWEFDPATSNWSQKANFPGIGRQSAAGFVIGNRAYIGTGVDGSFVFYNDLWELDPFANSWTQKGNFPGGARRGAFGFSINNKGYIGLGYDGTKKNDLWEYNPSADSWVQKSSGGTLREHTFGFVINGKAYNGCGIDNNSNFLQTVWEYNPCVSSTSFIQNVICNGGNNGTATANVTGGTFPFTFYWNPTSQPTQTATGLAAGNYVLNINDANGCNASDSVTITEPTALIANAGNPQYFCSDYPVIIGGSPSALGGTSPYTYSWGPSSFLSSTTVANPTAGPASTQTYTLIVNDSNACADTAFVTITTVPPASVSITSTNISCNGANDGLVTASGEDSYIWNSGQASASISGLAAGNYFVTATDAATGCTAIDSVTITEPSAFSGGISSTNISCSGVNDGTATASGTGGTTPYSFIWDNGFTGATRTNLSASSYSVTISDANGCGNLVYSATVNDPGVLSATVPTYTDVSCNGGNNGNAIASGGGGTGTYSFLWSDGQNTQTATGFVAGNYSVTITDANNCADSASITITEPSAISASPSLTYTLCYGGTNGYASVNPSGGTGPYSYIWSTGGTTFSENNLSAGTYYITITDNNGCVATDSATVNDPAALIASIVSTQNATCNGSSDGYAIADANGGTGGYTFLWSDSQTTQIADTLFSGNYIVTVTDGNGCTSTASATVNEPTLLTSTSSSTDASCFGGTDGQATVTASGGTTSYSFLWSNGQTGTTATALGGGNYIVTVTDANGCTSTQNINITEPPALSIVPSQTNVLCFGDGTGSASVNVSGGTTNYSYLWNTGAGTQTLVSLQAGNYSVTVTDANGCTNTQSFTISQPTPLVSTPSQTNVSCFGGNDGSANVIPVSGGTTPYTYLWSNGGITSNIQNLTSNIYSVTVSDANNCTTAQSYSIAEPSLLVVSAGNDTIINQGGTAALTVNAFGGTGTYNYLWNTVETTSSISVNPNSTAVYYADVTDGNGCSASDTVLVSVIQTNFFIFGTIYNQAHDTSINNGTVYLFPYDSLFQLAPVDSFLLGGGNGDYVFNNHQADDYIILFRPDTGFYPSAIPTYYGDTTNWEGAQILNLISDTGGIDISAREVPLLIGTGFISGLIQFGIGTGKTGNGTVIPFGDPVPGIDVELEQVPGGIVKHTTTNDSGIYTFSNLPLNSDYKIYVDITGLPMDSTYTVNLSSTDTIENNLDYVVDTTSGSGGIFIGFPLSSPNSEFPTPDFKIYPNPNNGKFTLSVNHLTIQPFNHLTIYNILGEKVYFKQLTTNNEQLTTNLSNGIYYIQILTQNGILNKKIIIQ